MLIENKEKKCMHYRCMIITLKWTCALLLAYFLITILQNSDRSSCKIVDMKCLSNIWTRVGCSKNAETYEAIQLSKIDHPQIKYWQNMDDISYVVADMRLIKSLAEMDQRYKKICFGND